MVVVEVMQDQNVYLTRFSMETLKGLLENSTDLDQTQSPLFANILAICL